MTLSCPITPSSEYPLGKFAWSCYVPAPDGTAEERIIAFVCGARFTEETLPIFLNNCVMERCDLVVFVRCAVGHPNDILTSGWYINESHDYDEMIRLATPHLQEREEIQRICRPLIDENSAILNTIETTNNTCKEYMRLLLQSNELERRISAEIHRTRSLPRLPMKVFLYDCMYNVEDLGHAASIPSFIDDLSLVLTYSASVDRATCHRYVHLPINGQTVISLFTEPDVLVSNEMITAMLGELIQSFVEHQQGNGLIELVIHESNTVVAFHEANFMTPDHLERLLRSLPEHVQKVQFHHCVLHRTVKCVCPPHLRVVEFNFCTFMHVSLEAMFISTQGGESSLTNVRFMHCDLRGVRNGSNILLPQTCIVSFYASMINEALKAEIESHSSVWVNVQTERHLIDLYRQICSEIANPLPLSPVASSEELDLISFSWYQD